VDDEKAVATFTKRRAALATKAANSQHDNFLRRHTIALEGGELLRLLLQDPRLIFESIVLAGSVATVESRSRKPIPIRSPFWLLKMPRTSFGRYWAGLWSLTLCYVQHYHPTHLAWAFSWRCPHHAQQRRTLPSCHDGHPLPLRTSNHGHNLIHHRNLSYRSQLQLSAKKNKAPLEVPPNEFSRTVPADRLSKLSSSSAMSSQQGYTLTIEASEAERRALALRFGLSDIGRLEASVVVQSMLSSGGSSDGGISVSGLGLATVTQRCVRTNDDFVVDVEFALDSLVRPVVPVGQDLLLEDNDGPPATSNDAQSRGRRTGSPNGRSKQKSADLGEIQRLLEQRMQENSFGNVLYNDDEDDAASLMEDEAIYCVNGALDVGELVAQLFWLQLDPYPKKPGTTPVQRSITG
jgi:hypothetical protein